METMDPLTRTLIVGYAIGLPTLVVALFAWREFRFRRFETRIDERLADLQTAVKDLRADLAAGDERLARIEGAVDVPTGDRQPRAPVGAGAIATGDDAERVRTAAE